MIFEEVENPSQNLDMTVKKGYNRLVYNVQKISGLTVIIIL